MKIIIVVKRKGRNEVVRHAPFSLVCCLSNEGSARTRETSRMFRQLPCRSWRWTNVIRKRS